jgi:hypothetical protein
VWTNKPIVREQGVAEGQLELNTPDPVIVVQDLKGNILDKINLSVATQKYKLGQPENIKKQLAHQNYTKIGNYTIVSPMTGQPQDATTQGMSEGMDGKVVFSGTGANGSTYEIIQSSPTNFMIHANGRHIDTYGSLQRAMSVLKNEVQGLQQGVAEASLGDYRKKAALSKATSQMDRFFGRDDPATVAAADQTIAKREKGLARADARTQPYTPPKFDAEKHQRDLTAKYPNIDQLVADAERNRDPYYDRAEGNAYYTGREAEQNYQRLKQIQRVIQGLNESLQRTQP